MPEKTDATTPCRCGGVMKLTMIEPVLSDPDRMQHSFTCSTCNEVERFRFLKKAKSASTGAAGDIR